MLAAEAKAVVARPQRGRTARASLPLDDSHRGCDACPLQTTWPQLSSPKMPLTGNREGDILVLAEAPGETEDRRGEVLVGQAGSLLRRILPHRSMERLALGNAVRCRPPQNRMPVAREIHACSTYLEEDIAAGNFKAILGLGGVPLSRFLTEASITQVHGLKFAVEIGEKVLWYYPTLHPSFVLRGGGDRAPQYPILANDIRTFFRDVDKWPNPVIEKPKREDVICAYNEDEARGYCNKLIEQGKRIGFDLETNGLRPNVVGAEIMTAAASDGQTSVAWPVRHPQAPNTWGLRLLLELTAALPWIAHHAGFELAWLLEHARRQGIEWEPGEFHDSMAQMRLHQQREGCLNLGIGTRLYVGTNIKKLSTVNTEKIAEEPLEHVLPYNGLDAWGSHRIDSKLFSRVDERNYDSILATIQSTVEMQLLGLDTDQVASAELRSEWEGRAGQALSHAKTLYEVKSYERELQREFNIGANEQVAEALMTFGRVTLPKTGSDKSYSTDDKALNAAAPDNPLVKDVLEYRHATKMVSTYIDPIEASPARFVDTRIHPCYSTVLTRTLRLSSEDPNIQNFPKRKDRELRQQVVPPPGCVFASFDYGQIEARVYAMASKDNALCDSIIANEDIHSYWLNLILNEYPPYLDRLREKVTPNDTEQQIRKGGRDIIKSDFVFASFFGTTAKNVADRTGMPLAVAQDVLGAFWTRYSGAKKWVNDRRREYMDTGTTRNLCNVVRYGIMIGNEPINTPIQSTAARIVLDSQNEMWRIAKQSGDPHLFPRINIHDDLTFALPDDDALLMTYIEEIAKVLVKVRFPWQIVPLKVEAKIGVNWADLHDVYEYTGSYNR